VCAGGQTEILHKALKKRFCHVLLLSDIWLFVLVLYRDFPHEDKLGVMLQNNDTSMAEVIEKCDLCVY
jgi:hypothetical protein